MKTTPKNKCKWFAILLNQTLKQLLNILYSDHCYCTASVLCYFSPRWKQRFQSSFLIPSFPISLYLMYYSYLMGNWSYYYPAQKPSVALCGLHDKVQSPYPDSHDYPHAGSNLPFETIPCYLSSDILHFKLNSASILYIPWTFSPPFPGLCYPNYFSTLQFCLYVKTYLICHPNDTPLLNFSPCPLLMLLNFQGSYQYHFTLYLFIPRSTSSPQ